jgi:hypothetical protein
VHTDGRALVVVAVALRDRGGDRGDRVLGGPAGDRARRQRAELERRDRNCGGSEGQDGEGRGELHGGDGGGRAGRSSADPLKH